VKADESSESDQNARESLLQAKNVEHSILHLEHDSHALVQSRQIPEGKEAIRALEKTVEHQ
jgi:hypothetical protein